MNNVQLYSRILKETLFSKIDEKVSWDKEDLRHAILEALADAAAKYADIIALPAKQQPKIDLFALPLSPLEEAEKEKIAHVMKQTMWNKSQAARMLGIDRKTLRSKIQLYGLLDNEILNYNNDQ